jgi:hypothetical protein
MKNMGGIFIVHYIMSAIAVGTALLYKWAGWDQFPLFAKTGKKSRKSVRDLAHKVQRSIGLEKNHKTETSPSPEVKLDPRHEMILQAAQQKTLSDLFRKNNASGVVDLNSSQATMKRRGSTAIPPTYNTNARRTLVLADTEHPTIEVDDLGVSLRVEDLGRSSIQQLQSRLNFVDSMNSETGSQLSWQDAEMEEADIRAVVLEEKVEQLALQQDEMQQSQHAMHQEIGQILAFLKAANSSDFTS